jgi:hypothetical protein
LVEEIQWPGVVALDLETTGLDPRRHETAPVAGHRAGAWVVDLFADTAPVLEALE